jgi:hypothetical protein
MSCTGNIPLTSIGSLLQYLAHGCIDLGIQRLHGTVGIEVPPMDIAGIHSGPSAGFEGSITPFDRTSILVTPLISELPINGVDDFLVTEDLDGVCGIRAGSRTHSAVR